MATRDRDNLTPPAARGKSFALFGGERDGKQHCEDLIYLLLPMTESKVKLLSQNIVCGRKKRGVKEDTLDGDTEEQRFFFPS